MVVLPLIPCCLLLFQSAWSAFLRLHLDVKGSDECNGGRGVDKRKSEEMRETKM